MKFSSPISVLATFTAVCAASAGTEDQPFFTMILTVQCDSDEECNNGLPTPFVTQLQDGKRIHNSSINFAEKDAEYRSSHLDYTTHYRTISEIIFDGTSDKERQFRVDGMHIWRTKSAEYNLLCNVTFDRDLKGTNYTLDLQNRETGLYVDNAGVPKVDCVVSLETF